MSFNTSDNCYSVARFQVSATPGFGNYIDIPTANADASAGDTIFLMPGTYTVSNLILKNNVNYSALCFGGGSGESTRILGNMIDNGVTVNCTFTGITIENNGGNFLTLTNASSQVIFGNCEMRATNGTGMSLIAGSTVFFYNCDGNVTAAQTMSSGAGNLAIIGGNITGNSTAITTMSGGIQLSNAVIGFPIACTGTGSITIQNSVVNNSNLNSISITTAGSGTSSIRNSTILSGTASAISIGTGSTLQAFNCNISSSNTNAITGLGTFVDSGLSMIGTSNLVNVITQTPSIFIRGADKVTIPSSYPYTILGTDEIISVDTTTTANTVNLPAIPIQGKAYTVKDKSANASVHNITVSGNGNNIVGTTIASTLVISSNGGSVNFNYDGTNYIAL